MIRVFIFVFLSCLVVACGTDQLLDPGWSGGKAEEQQTAVEEPEAHIYSRSQPIPTHPRHNNGWDGEFEATTTLDAEVLSWRYYSTTKTLILTNNYRVLLCGDHPPVTVEIERDGAGYTYAITRIEAKERKGESLKGFDPDLDWCTFDRTVEISNAPDVSTTIKIFDKGKPEKPIKIVVMGSPLKSFHRLDLYP